MMKLRIRCGLFPPGLDRCVSTQSVIGPLAFLDIYIILHNVAFSVLISVLASQITLPQLSNSKSKNSEELILQFQITFNRSFQIFNTQFYNSLKFNLPPQKAILLERMSANLRVSPSHLVGIPPHLAPEEGVMCVKNPADHFFRPINLKKRIVCFPTSRRQYLKLKAH